MKADKFLEKAAQRDEIIETILKKLEGDVKVAQNEMLRSIVEDVVNQLETKDGVIINNSKNKRLLLNLDLVFTRFSQNNGLEIVKSIIESVTKIIDFNTGYFGLFNRPARLAPIKAKVIDSVNSWLGITEDGGIAKNGYLDVLLKDPAIKNQVRNQLAQAVISQQGHSAAQKGIREYVAGKPGQTGRFEQYMRNTVYDTFSIADRATAQIFADELKLNYAIYEGGLIETSRTFCINHNGKVYSRTEIAGFKPDKAIPPNYNPFTDLGGYGCRHHLNWIPETVAFALRPELRNAA